MESLIKAMLKFPGFALLDPGSNLVNDKINITPLSLFSVSGLLIIKKVIKDIRQVIRSLENRGILFLKN